jgi:hypothetical protein
MSGAVTPPVIYLHGMYGNNFTFTLHVSNISNIVPYNLSVSGRMDSGSPFPTDQSHLTIRIKGRCCLEELLLL